MTYSSLRRPRTMLGVIVVCCAVLGAGSAATAQKRLVVGSDFVGCDSYGGCELAGDCDGTDTCEFVEAFDGMYCITPTGPTRDVLCCNPSDDPPCPDFGGGHGTCLSLADGVDVCVYPDDPRLACVESGSAGDSRLETLAACFRTVDGAPVRNWELGDCDRDGTPNATESEGCVCNPEDSCGEVLDAGVPDAGPEETDAGPEEDEDAGSGPNDAGREKMDGGRTGDEDPLNGVDFRGSGGCSCDSAAGAGLPPAAALAVIVGAALARRRRRRR